MEIDVAGNQKTYAYYGQGQLGAGRVSSITQPGGVTTTYQYNARGQVTQQAGSGSYPIDYTYHPTDGWLTEMWTYTSAVAPANANKTFWEYDPATGLLLHKKDHLLRATSYEYYTGTRLLQKRLWQRTVPIAGTPRLTTTYSYDKGGLLSKVEYNDGTPTTLVTYDRASRCQRSPKVHH